MKSRWIILALLILTTSFIPASAQEPPTAEPAACPDTFQATLGIDCFVVTVPQDRAHPEEREVRLMVAVFKARGANVQPDPLIFLDGGPGSRTLDSFAAGVGDFLSRFNLTRDIIVFDYRGIGYADPALTCPEQLEEMNTGWVEACRARHEANGVDMTDYTTRDNAADAADIVRALGYETYNIWGGSYGSSVAMTLLRDQPENIRAAIVTALQPPQGDLTSGIPVYFQRTIATISDLCAADAACSAALPGDLVEELAAIVTRLNETPIPATIRGVETVLTGDDILSGLGQLLKDEKNIGIVPGLLATLYAESYDLLITYANTLTPPPDPLNPIGAYLSMRCTDSVLAVTPEAFEAALESIDPAFRDAYRKAHVAHVEQCQTWGARVPTEADLQPAVTDTPVLIISGALDPYSSVEWLESSLATLPNGHGFMLPNHLHYVIGNRCAANLLVGFIADPSAPMDFGCTADVPAPSFSTR